METHSVEDEYSSGEERSYIRSFFTAIEENDLCIVSKFLNNSKYIFFANSPDANNGNNMPLHMAIKRRSKKNIDKDANKKIIELLINKGADVKAKNNKNETPLDLVKNEKNVPDWLAIKALLEQAPSSTSWQSESQPNYVPKRILPNDTESDDTDQGNPLPKRPKTDNFEDEFYTSTSALKQTLHGPIYQLQLLMLFVQRGINNKYDSFYLDTEMDKAEKFDDVVFKYKESAKAENFTMRFMQAKHKQDKEKHKITLNDLTTYKDEDFSLQKYFVSFCKIQNNEKFRENDLEDFAICTNTNFDFEPKKGEHKTTKVNKEKLKNFFTREKDLKNDKILYFEGQEGKEVRLDVTKIRVKEEIKRALEKNIEAVKKKPRTQINTNKLADLKEAHESFEKNFGIFLDKFRFVINYPDVDKLNSLIEREVGVDFQLLNADLVTHSFQKNMLDWLKHHLPSILSKKDAQIFFSLIQTKIHSLITAGFNKAYPEKLGAYKIGFKENLEKLKEFLSSENSQIFHISSQFTRLSAIRVLKSLNSVDLYKNHDSFIFLRLRTLLRQETKRYVLEAFSTNQKKTYDLLVIECQSKDQEKEDELRELYHRLTKVLKDYLSKKIILIAPDALVAKFNIIVDRRIKDETSFKDLDEDSQKKVLNSTINFQGKDIFLIALIDKDSASEIIDQSSLLQLLEQERIEIGNDKAFYSIGYVKDYYIKREFYRQRIKAEVLNKSSSNLFFITGASEEHLIKLGAEKDSLRKWNGGHKYDKGIILHAGGSNYGESSHEIFEKLQRVHWLEYRNGDLFWRCSKQGMLSLDEYIEEEYVTEEYLTEEYFNKPEAHGEKVFIIANSPGMGKSTVLTSVANKMKAQYPALWVVRVNLNEYALDKEKPESLHNINFEKEVKESEIQYAIEFVSKMAITGESCIELQLKLFQAGLKKFKNADGKELKTPKIVILFDGFDEISSYKDSTLNLIMALKESEVAQLWITTRVHEKNHLEEMLGSPAYILNCLTEEKQIDFLSRNWKWNLKFYKERPYSEKVCEWTYKETLEHLKQINLPDESYATELTEEISHILETVDNPKSLKEAIDDINFYFYAEGFLSQWKKSIRDRGKEFTIVPLHLRMLTDVVFQNKFPLAKDYGLNDLYDTFIKVKFDILREEKATGSANTTVNAVLKGYKSASRRVHQELSVKIFFTGEYKKQQLPGLDELNRFNKDYGKYKKGEVLAMVGLLSLNEDQLEFIHRSFAEYFLSEYLFENLENEQVQKLLIEKILRKKDYELIRKFFNGRLEKTSTSIKSQEAVKNLMTEDLAKSDHQETILHILADEGQCGIFEFLLKTIQDDAELLGELMAKTKRGITALHLAIWGNYDKIVEQMLYVGLLIDPETFRNEILQLKSGEGTILILAAARGYNEIVRIVLDFVMKNEDHLGKGFLKKFVLETDCSGETALYHASNKEDTETVKILLNFIREYLGEDTLIGLVLQANKINDQDDTTNQTSLHIAAWKGHNEIVSEFLNSIKDSMILKELVLKTDYFGATVLLETVKSGTVKIFLEHIKNNSEALEDLVILSVYGDARKYPKSVVDNLLRITEKTSEIYENLISIRNNLDEVDRKRYSLHKAIIIGDDDSVKRILNQSHAYLKELALATYSNAGTALHEAAEGNQSEILEKLLKSIKNYPRILEELVLKVCGSEKETALHRAARHGHHQTVLKLMNFVKDHLGKESIKKVLLKPKCTGTPAIFAAHYRSRHQTVKVFLEFLAEFVPEILEKQVKTIGDSRAVFKWAQENNYWELKERLLVLLGASTYELREAAANGDITALKALLDGHKSDVQFLKQCLGVSDGETLLNLCTGNNTFTLLNWVKENLEEDPPGITIKKLVLESHKDLIINIEFLSWVKNNLEKIHPGIIKKLLMKDVNFDGKNSLSRVFWNCDAYIARDLLNWVKDNTDEETFRDVILATDYEGKNVLHSSIFDSDIVDKSTMVQYLLETVKNHPKIFQALALQTDANGRTALDLACHTSAIRPGIEKHLIVIVGLLKEHYNNIVLDLITNICDFSNEQLAWMEKYVRSDHYAEQNKQEILVKLKEI